MPSLLTHRICSHWSLSSPLCCWTAETGCWPWGKRWDFRCKWRPPRYSTSTKTQSRTGRIEPWVCAHPLEKYTNDNFTEGNTADAVEIRKKFLTLNYCVQQRFFPRALHSVILLNSFTLYSQSPLARKTSIFHLPWLKMDPRAYSIALSSFARPRPISDGE